jgi:hypothetical protein
MAQTNIYIDNILTEDIRNLDALSIELNFNRDKPQQQVSITNLDTVISAKKQLDTWVSNGKIFEGMPLRIEITEGSTTEVPFNGYIDLTDSTDYSCEDIKANIKELKTLDWLNDNSDGISFESIYNDNIGVIQIGGTPDPAILKSTDVISVPYVINSVPNNEAVAFALISTSVIYLQLSKASADLAMHLIGSANPFEGTELIKTVVEIAYVVGLLASVAVQLKQLFDLLIQPIKYHSAMRISRQLEAGLSNLGLTLDCPELQTGVYKNAVIMPIKYSLPNDKNGMFGHKQRVSSKGYFNGTLKDLLLITKTLLNGKIVVRNGVVSIVRFDTIIGTPQYTLPPIQNEQYRLNADKMRSNVLYEFEVDFSDKNTIQEYKGTTYQVFTTPTVVNEPYRLTKGYDNVRFGLALGKTKRELNKIENILINALDIVDGLVNVLVTIVNAIINVYNEIAKFINKIIKALKTIGIKLNITLKPIKPITKLNLSGFIENRIGYLMIEQDFTSVPKIMCVNDNGKLQANNDEVLSAKYIYENYYIANSFMPNKGGQKKIMQYENVPFCLENYWQVKDNNFIFDSNGNTCEVLSLQWNIYGQTANITLQHPYNYTNNLTQQFYEPTGD